MIRRADLIALLLVPTAALDTEASSAPEKPNVVILLADDLGYGDITCYGGAIQTPQMDRLAREGLRFTDFHANGPNCTPSRCALLTGRYQNRAGLPSLCPLDKGLEPEAITFAEVLKSSGYATAIYGKWHLGHADKYNPIHQGFDEFRGFLGGTHSYFVKAEGGAWRDGLGPSKEEGYSTTLIADDSIDFIRRSKDRPFCVYAAFNAPHAPICDPETGRRAKTAEGYGNVVKVLDREIGRIVAALEKWDLEKKTLVLFMSDNGAPDKVAGASNKPLRGEKGTGWEGGHRVPAMAWWPGRIAAGRVTDQTTMIMDVMPTLVELAGGTLPAGHALDGVSLVSLLRDGTRLPPRRVFLNKGSHHVMRDGPWKLLVVGNQPYLFSLEDDLPEQRDLAGRQPERFKTMVTQYNEWATEVGARTLGEKGAGKSGKEPSRRATE